MNRNLGFITRCLGYSLIRNQKCFISNSRYLPSLIKSKQINYANIHNSIRKFSSSNQDVIEKEFQTAIANFSKLTTIDNDMKLRLIALCKQGSIGPCTSDKPSMFNADEKAEYQAWKALGEMSQDDAKKQYTELVNKLLNENPDKQKSQKEPELVFEERDQVYWIKLNRPKQYNAITPEMYQGLIDALKRSGEDPGIKFTVITGNGPYFSSGNDLNNFPRAIEEYDGDIPKAMDESRALCQRFVSAFIDFPKMLIGAINGPAFGIMFTTLGLYDCVISTEKAFFTCPFSSLGQSPEGCSTHTFPQIFGPSKASELLYFNYRMPAEEAHRLGFLSRIVPSDQLQNHLEEWLYSEKGLVKTCYPNSMFNAKGIVRNEETRLMLHEINKVECDFLQQSWSSEECADALQKFYSRK
uniref:Enoyl-CoA delta isomerase 2, mitochondrial-like n=1 Tax=Dermatophagoides pteronyssinus TaxID=6956 RepID=A0A6P6XQN8_DERPT|nr:enoyl-CoA delta isomerase 2, mitochondrial-like [Dermatophagoides pteronyssinus]